MSGVGRISCAAFLAFFFVGILGGCSMRERPRVDIVPAIGKTVEFDAASANWELDLLDDGKVYQILYDYTGGELKPRKVYRCDDFIKISSENKTSDGSDSFVLSVNTASAPVEQYREVYDKNAIDAFKKLLIPISFSEKNSTLIPGELMAEYIVKDGAEPNRVLCFFHSMGIPKIGSFRIRGFHD